MKTILLVEDDRDIRFLYASKLRLEGYVVLEAVNGQEALNILKEQTPDIALVDLLMPIMGGVEFISQVRSSEDEIANIKIVVLTNLSKSEAPHDLRYMNILTYIMKAHTTPVQLAHDVTRLLAG